MQAMIHARESVIMAEDYESLVQWYQDALGFKVAKQFSGDFHYTNLETDSGIKIGIAAAKEMDIVPGNRSNNTVVLQFQVADVQAFFEHLKSHKGAVTFGPSFDKKDQFWFGGFQDLEGNPFWVVDENCP